MINEIAKVCGDHYGYIGNVQMMGWSVFSSKIGNPVVANNSSGDWCAWYSYLVE